MSLATRIAIYQQIEAVRKRPLISYVTSTRIGVNASISADVVAELQTQLQKLPPDTKELDLLLISNGGDATVAWRIVSLIRERVSKFSVLIPQAAFSAATLVALGADEIVMHQHGNLGPVDVQLINHQKQNGFGSEDLAAFLDFAKKKVGVSDQSQLMEAFKLFCAEAGAIPIGIAARGSQLSMALGERLLLLHMKADEAQKAKAISETLNRNYFHHGYPIGFKEAKEIGLKVKSPQNPLSDLLWQFWLDIETELDLRSPFLPMSVLKNDPACSALFGPVQMLNIPTNVPINPQLMQQILSNTVVHVPPADHILTHALMESSRLASTNYVEFKIFGARLPDFKCQVNLVPVATGWRTEALPASTAKE